MAETKYCHGCARTLHASRFHRNRSSKDGLNTYCKECKHARAGYGERVQLVKTATAKECSRCHEMKPLAQFFRRLPDRRVAWCKSCEKRVRRTYIAKNQDAIWRRRRAKHEHLAALARARARLNPEREREANARKRAKWPEKAKARAATKAAVASGVLVRQPCERCGSPRAHGHHEDYAKPLEVTWLCSLHHAERHREIRLGRLRHAG